MRHSFAIALLLILTACIDPITFETGSEPRRLVVDGFISNISFEERAYLPAPASKFYLALRWTSNVDNVKDEVISGAKVSLIASDGTTIDYLWSEADQRYLILDDSFAAKEGVNYKVHIETANGAVYESDPDSVHPAPQLEEVEVDYQTIVKSIDVAGQAQLVNQRGVQVSVPLPSHSGEPYRLRWKIIPSWIFETSRLPVENSNQQCFATNLYEYQDIKVWEDKNGGYSRDLFFLETDDNEQVQYGFSAYITQYSLSPAGFEFWNQLAIQQQSGGGIFDPPPFSLITNIRNVNNPDELVSGYFYVAHESSIRWNLSPEDLPYNLQFIDACEPIPGVPYIPPAGCSNCLEYRGVHTDITNEKPEWWEEF
ncbi:DUF4249 domain-containing protein [uncultured Algoriphagus sp.]|uniref:DUF4249 domain-containing protein n=1 Tax=uncultured Algoriphagus sp. TaxID=417365 RepID=UPI0030EB83E3|tara:strand:- start:47002 stop:48108 length:1107 start_codon:yes stop_codon:yes gene_type:complete